MTVFVLAGFPGRWCLEKEWVRQEKAKRTMPAQPRTAQDRAAIAAAAAAIATPLT